MKIEDERRGRAQYNPNILDMDFINLFIKGRILCVGRSPTVQVDERHEPLCGEGICQEIHSTRFAWSV